MQTLSGRTIMIVEDDYYLACELADHFRAAKAKVLGPFPSVVEATDYVEDADLAVLDVNLRDQEVYLLADLLMGAAVPFVFYSAHEVTKIPRRFARVARLPKPYEARATVELLRNQIHTQTLMALLPKLRLSARLILTDPAAADRLVEATLLLAIEEQSGLQTLPPLEKWLQHLMERALAERGRDLLH
ncbi:hypothetical protein [Rhodobacter sp. 24-YEA-8]|uniref:hypothetical protein n=1 Tax=Rhodobacter sp. 24-YEA-8 TaxID=1884310 RepID=UPI00089B34CB|nr:hypothetical protein [Rhodobacter sp. 24-YEA-8]SED49542.1 response regulator receiver protein [Rhodobacter sp. 24-YEA-8]